MEKKRPLQQLSDAYSFLAYESSDCESNKSVKSDPVTKNDEWINPPSEHSDNEDLMKPIEVTKTELSHRLTGLVRKQYTNFLRNQLHIQYKSYLHDLATAQSFSANVQKFVEHLEQQALHSCMIVSLYRKKMLEIIADVRQEKNKNQFHDILRIKPNASNQNTDDKNKISVNLRETPKYQSSPPTIIKKRFANAKVQTDPVDFARIARSRPKPTETDPIAVSLDEKIKKFEMKLKEEERKRKQFSHFLAKKELEEIQKEKSSKKMKITPDPSFSPCTPVFTPSSVGTMSVPFFPVAPIAAHQSLLVQPQATPHIEPVSILQPPEIPPALLNPVNIPSLAASEDTIAQELQALFGPEDDNNDDIFSESVQNPQIDAIITEIYNSDVPNQRPPETSDDGTTNQIESLQHTTFGETVSNMDQIADNTVEENASVPLLVNYDDELRNSLWPCELHMQRLRLRQILNGIADKGMRHNEKVQLKFILLFGEYGIEADMEPYSPSVELDDIIMASCKKRIAPWIVKYLMQPMQDGLIANRYLFKKLAKHLAATIMFANQYPEEKVIKTVVSEYFCTHSYVGTVNDIN